ncbi:leucine-zipper-like transcriptional regulator 1 [Argopecten irradians]|uniref:leucine-zipper-like transcriptional regulator 1 n=1 Tax=Argopecten irradians TaxID=31199 RepID=UPI00371A95A9
MATSSPSVLWHGKKSIVESLESLFISGTSCDITFIVGDKRTRIDAHKFILVCRSPVFSVMFEGPLAEKDAVVIPDIPAAIFHIFLRYLYTDCIRLTLENAAPLLDLSRKYWLDILATKCETYLLERVSSTNAHEMLEQAIIFVIDSVRMKCLKILEYDFIHENEPLDLDNEFYPNTSKIFMEYRNMAEKTCDKYRALLMWLKGENDLNSKKVVPFCKDSTDGKKSLLECLGEMFKCSTRSDVIFVVGEKMKRIHAHRLILISRSPVFYAMFEGHLAAKGEIILSETSAKSFHLFLRYLYTDEFRLRPKEAVAVYDIARMFCVDRYYSDMTRNITLHNVCRYLEQAHTFRSARLQARCFKWFVKNPIDVILTPAFGDLCSSCMISLVEADIFWVSEEVVCEAIVFWAEKECERLGLKLTHVNQRKILGDLADRIPFPVMDNYVFDKSKGSPGRNRRWAFYNVPCLVNNTMTTYRTQNETK